MYCNVLIVESESRVTWDGDWGALKACQLGPFILKESHQKCTSGVLRSYLLFPVGTADNTFTKCSHKGSLLVFNVLL
jgi:hypothetical protein